MIPEEICSLDSRRQVLEKIKGRVDAGSRLIDFYGPTLSGKSATIAQLEKLYPDSLCVHCIDLGGAARAQTEQRLGSGIIWDLLRSTPTAVCPDEVSRAIASTLSSLN